MGNILHSDDNQRVVATPQGFRPTAGAANIVKITMSGSTQTATLPTVGSGGTRGDAIFYMVGTQPILFAVDKSGQSANYTADTNMIYVPANTCFYFGVNPLDTTLYVLQGGTAGVCYLAALT